jgi:hypothetical protein
MSEPLEEHQYCVNCIHYETLPLWILHFLPIIGSLFLLMIKWCDTTKEYRDGIHVFKQCGVSGKTNFVTGGQLGKLACHQARASFYGNEESCRKFLSRGRPLKDVPDKWIVTEIKKRGLLKVMQNAKRDES